MAYVTHRRCPVHDVTLPNGEMTAHELVRHGGRQLSVAAEAPEPCGCEHEAHFSETDAPPVGHKYLAVPAGTRRAMYVGEVCDGCADGHMARYIR